MALSPKQTQETAAYRAVFKLLQASFCNCMQASMFKQPWLFLVTLKNLEKPWEVLGSLG